MILLIVVALRGLSGICVSQDPENQNQPEIIRFTAQLYKHNQQLPKVVKNEKTKGFIRADYDSLGCQTSPGCERQFVLFMWIT